MTRLWNESKEPINLSTLARGPLMAAMLALPALLAVSVGCVLEEYPTGPDAGPGEEAVDEFAVGGEAVGEEAIDEDATDYRTFEISSSLLPDPEHVGGVVIDALPIPISWSMPKRYIGSPSIVVLPDGTYVASHDVPIKGGTTNVTYVFRSDDRGATWQKVSTLNGICYGSLFAKGGALYIIGRNTWKDADDSMVVVFKSRDRGSTWEDPSEVLPSVPGMTPSAPAIYNGRLWFPYGGKGAISVPLNDSSVDDHLLDPSAWKKTNLAHPSSTHSNTEGQIVASPKTGLVVMPKTRYTDENQTMSPVVPLIRIKSETEATFDQKDWVHLPGGDKKFGCQYDAVSGKFYALTNPVLPVHADEDHYGLTRNTGMILSSRDLYKWKVEKIFLYSPEAYREAFQYFNFAFDGDDMVVVARTGLKVGGFLPSRGHDANLLTFHRVRNFRSLSRDQILVADTGHNQVLRYEANLTSRLAPLGSFTNLVSMTKPMGVAQSDGSDIFIAEETANGRILRFNSMGNIFKGVVATAGVDFTGTPESLAFGTDGYLFLSTAFGSNTDKIWRIDPDTDEVTLFVDTHFSSQWGAGTLNEPRGIAFGPNGHLYVADRANNRIRRFHGVSGSFLGNLTTDQRKPQALTWDEHGNRFLFSRRTTDSDNDIARALTSGSVLTLYTNTDVGLALGIVSIDGRIFWTDYNNNKIYMITNEAQKAKTTSVSTGLSHPGNMARVVTGSSGPAVVQPIAIGFPASTAQ